jgi:hypothetical protein
MSRTIACAVVTSIIVGATLALLVFAVLACEPPQDAANSANAVNRQEKDDDFE